MRNSNIQQSYLPKHNLGRVGEDLAAEYFIKIGYSILQKNWRLGRYAEVDLIVKDPLGNLIFVEVKTRRLRNKEAGFRLEGFEAINWRKQKKITTSAQIYLQQNSWNWTACRFDVVIIQLDANSKSIEEPILIHIAEAFHP